MFFSFLIYIITEDKVVYEEDKIQVYGENSDESLKIKYQLVCDEIKSEFEFTKISEINNRYLSDLIVEKKISNRENSISQEIVSMHKKGYDNQSIKLSEELIESILNSFDDKEQRKWVNYHFYYNEGNSSFIFYDKKSVLTEFNNSKIGVNCSFYTSPYYLERYYITFNNDSVEVVEVNLITFDGEEKLSKYIDLNTRKSIVDIKKIESEFVLTEEKYFFNFLVWS